MVKRERALFALLTMPIAVFAWCIGWGLYWVGGKKIRSKPELNNKKDNLALAVLLPEDRIEA